MSWEGRGTKLPLGFNTLRIRTNQLQCWVEEPVRLDGRYITEPVHLLCRTLRLAPACFRRFKWTPEKPKEMLHLKADASFYAPEDDDYPHRSSAKCSYTVVELAAAMSRCGAAEGLIVDYSPKPLSIVVRRASTEANAVAADVQHVG